MMKTKTMSKLAVIVFGLIMLVCVAVIPAFLARAAGITVTSYPFEKGENAFASSVRFSSATIDKKDQWLFGGIKGNKSGVFDLTGAEYLAIQMKNNGKTVGFDIGYEIGDARFHLDGGETGGKPVYWVSEDGTVINDTIQFASAHMPEKFTGMVIVPMTSIKLNYGTSPQNLAAVANIHITTNGLYNNHVDVTMGDIGFYDGEIGGATTKFVTVFSNDGNGAGWIADQTEIRAEMKREYVKSIAQTTWDGLDNVVYKNAFNNYPFLKTKVTGEGALIITNVTNQWTGVTSFKMEAKNIGNAAKIRYEYKSGETVTAIKNFAASIKNGAAAAEAVPVGEDGIIDIAVGFSGTIEIPVELTTVDGINVRLNAEVNPGVRLVVGILGATKDKIVYKEMASAANADKFAAYKLSGSTAITMAKYSERFATGAAAHTLGSDIKLVQTYDTMLAPLVPWTGGAPGTTELIDRNLGKAIKLTVGEFDSAKDPYMAVDIPVKTAASKDVDDWSGAKGITFYAENLSASEVAFNIEFNLSDLSTGSIITDERFNIRLGARYYLVDVVTGVEMIYVAQPVISIPVGFKGYVRVPFNAYKKAEWAAGDGIIDSYDLATYMCITCDSRDYEGFEYVLDDVGVYYKNFELNTSYHKTENSVKTYMDLDV